MAIFRAMKTWIHNNRIIFPRVPLPLRHCEKIFCNILFSLNKDHECYTHKKYSAKFLLSLRATLVLRDVTLAHRPNFIQFYNNDMTTVAPVTTAIVILPGNVAQSNWNRLIDGLTLSGKPQRRLNKFSSLAHITNSCMYIVHVYLLSVHA